MRRAVIIIGLIFMFTDGGSTGPIQLPGPPPVTVKHGVRYVATVQTDMGTFYMELYSEDAPRTVSNFIYLAQKDFFNGLTFHRIVPGHVIQGGDPAGTGAGDAGYTIPFEQSPHKHLEGSVGMARSGNDMNSASSQFYICLAARPHLDGKYTIFGRVYEGMEVVRKIGQVPTGAGERPIKPVYIYRVIIGEMPSSR